MKKFLLVGSLIFSVTSMFAGMNPNLIKMDSPSKSEIQTSQKPGIQTSAPEKHISNNGLRIEFKHPDPSKQVEPQRIGTRTAEDAYCEIIGSIFNENSDWENVPMELQADGKYILTPGMTYAGDFILYYNAGNGEGSHWIYNSEADTPLDEPIKCTLSNEYYFELNKGDYTLIFDPEDFTLTISGEILPPDYYLSGSFNSYVLGDPGYKFTQSPENDAVYTLSWEGALTTNFAINTGSWLQFWATDNLEKVIQLNEPYQTVEMGKWYIQLPEGLEVVNPSLTFNIETGVLTIDGTYQKPEYGYQLYTNIFGYENYYWPMTETSDGNWVFDNNLHAQDGWFVIQKYNKRTNVAEQWIYREDGNGYITLDEPISCNTNGSYFYVRPGEYKFLFNPEEMTLKVTGEMDPPVYYFYNSVTGSSFRMYETEEGSGIYYTNPDFCPSGYYIYDSYGEYYGSNGLDLIPGQAYSTVNGYNDIHTDENLNFVNTTVLFEPKTGTLTISGETSVPNVAYAMSGTIFHEEDGWYYAIMDQEENGLYSIGGSSFYQGYFILMEYDLTLGKVYRYLGPLNDFTEAEPNQAYSVAQNTYYFVLKEGSYDFTFDANKRTLIVTRQEEEPQDLYLTQSSNPIIYSNGALIDFNIISLKAPSAPLYTVYMKTPEDTEYKFMQTDTSYFTMEINDLKPETNYSFELYVDCEVDGATYTSPVIQLELTTSYIYWNTGAWLESCTDNELTFQYSVTANVLEDTQFYMNYAIIEGTIQPDSETAENADYTKVPLNTNYGSYTIEGLNPETEYIVYIYFSIESEGETFESAKRYFWCNTSSSSVTSMFDDDSETVYYNLNGLRVKNPSNGLFIEIKGGKSRKVYLK